MQWYLNNYPLGNPQINYLVKSSKTSVGNFQKSTKVLQMSGAERQLPKLWLRFVIFKLPAQNNLLFWIWFWRNNSVSIRLLIKKPLQKTQELLQPIYLHMNTIYLKFSKSLFSDPWKVHTCCEVWDSNSSIGRPWSSAFHYTAIRIDFLHPKPFAFKCDS